MSRKLIERARREGHPLIENNRVTFLWEGDSAPRLIDDLHGWDEHPQKMRRVSPDLWAVSFDLARDAYLEYSFYDPATKSRLRDPLNKKRIWNGVGDYNHFFYLPEASPSPWTTRKRDIPRIGGTRSRSVRARPANMFRFHHS